ncbi:MAG TPA: hypothetical protein VJ302_27770 [Blastocatellia bacterium]|nr:hypothetical protein [Blastocatellia bacterium]
MNSPTQIYRANLKSGGEGQPADESIKPGSHSVKWSVVVEEAKALFNRLSRNSTPVQTSPSEMTARPLDETSGVFIAKESFKRGNDLVFFGDELYKWRDEFNLRPTFIALRNIESGEEVISNPADLERSDLMLHWGLACRND